MYTVEVTKRDFAFEISTEDYFAIEQRDDANCDAAHERGERFDYNTMVLSGILDAIEGVSDTDYNGHFGPYIYFGIDAENDTTAKREEVAQTIMDYINGRGQFA